MSETEIPDKVRLAAMLVGAWFQDHNCKRWELFEICSRNHADDLRAIKSITDRVPSFETPHRSDFESP